NGGIGHNGGGVGIAQDNLVALLLQSQAGLGACIVKLRSLSNHNGAGADNQNFLDVCSFCHNTYLLNYLLYTTLPWQTVSTQVPFSFQPAKGVALPMERNCSGSTVNSSSKSHTVKSSPIGRWNRFRGFSEINWTSRSSVSCPVFTKWVYITGNAVSIPTTPKALPARPLLFSSRLWGAWSV